jgi:hypothetical protein
MSGIPTGRELCSAEARPKSRSVKREDSRLPGLSVLEDSRPPVRGDKIARVSLLESVSQVGVRAMGLHDERNDLLAITRLETVVEAAVVEGFSVGQDDFAPAEVGSGELFQQADGAVRAMSRYRSHGAGVLRLVVVSRSVAWAASVNSLRRL